MCLLYRNYFEPIYSFIPIYNHLMCASQSFIFCDNLGFWVIPEEFQKAVQSLEEVR